MIQISSCFSCNRRVRASACAGVWNWPKLQDTDGNLKKIFSLILNDLLQDFTYK